MTASNFAASLKLVLESEGGNDDDPQDHGGRTSRGITQREYDAWRREKGLPILDVWQAPQEDIDTIYHDEYWEPYCDAMPTGVDYIYFNNAVLDGPHRATILLQQAIGVTADGRIGPVTRQAVLNANPSATIIKLSDASYAFYRGLHQPRFLKGWLNRVSSVEKNALTMTIASAAGNQA
jgi:lysozyme family protein